MKRAWLVGEKVYLRPLERADIGAGWHDWVNDPVHTQGLWTPIPQTLEMMESYWQGTQGPSTVAFAVCDRQDDAFIGNARLSEITWIHRSCYYGRLISPHYAGKGYGSDALIQLLRYGFYTLGINRIWSSAWVDNQASLGSNRKIGMTEEGILRQHVYKDGRFHDAVALDDRYIIEPAFRTWWIAVDHRAPARPVGLDFAYASDTNPDWLSVDDLRALVAGLEKKSG